MLDFSSNKYLYSDGMTLPIKSYNFYTLWIVDTLHYIYDKKVYFLHCTYVNQCTLNGILISEDILNY